MLSSLELNWLKHYDKSLILPKVVFSENLEFSGCYYCPHNSETYIDGKLYPREKGIIVVNPIENMVGIAETISHEWRHHWQFFNMPEQDSKEWNSKGWDLYSNYNNAIVEFFRNSLSEMDALKFEITVCGPDHAEVWIKILEQAGINVSNPN